MNSIVAEKRYISQALNVRYEDLSQSYVRAESVLSSTTQIPFNLQASKVSSPIITERLLGLNDQFVITHLGFSLKQIAADSPTNAQHQAATLYKWENPLVFTGANAANVSTIYNGSLSFTINRKEYIPNFPVSAFRRVPRTQENTQWVYTGGGVAATSIRGKDSVENALWGFYPTEPTIIDGRQTLDIKIDLGNAAVSFDDASNAVYAVLECRGYLIVNAKN